jgi:hypothetical protein
MNLILERSRRDHMGDDSDEARGHAGLPRSPPQGNALTELTFSWKVVCVLCGSGRVAVSGSHELELDPELELELPLRVVLSSPLELLGEILHDLLDLLLRARHHRDESRPGRLALPRLWQPQLARVHFTTTTARPELPLNGRIAGPTQGETISV